MKRVGKLIGLAAIAVVAGANLAVAPAAALDVTQVVGTTSVRLVSTGPQSAPLGITIAEDSIIFKIVVETYDDYDAIGAPANQFRDNANQKQEQVFIEIGGQRIGSLTDDVPELGPGGDRRKASITTTVFDGERKVKGGEVVVHHGRNRSTPNSVQVRKVTIWYFDAGSGGPYSPDNGGVIIDDDDDEEDEDEDEQEEEDEQDEDEEDESKKVESETTASTAAPETKSAAVVTTTVAPAVLNAGVATTSTTSTTTTTTTTTTVASSAQPTGAIVASAGLVAGSTSPSTATARANNGTLPVTGSDSLDGVRLGAVLALGGLGLVLVAGIRRRSSSLRRS